MIPILYRFVDEGVKLTTSCMQFASYIVREISYVYIFVGIFFQLVCTLGEPDQLHGEAVVLPLLQVPARHRTNTSQEEASGTARV